jgi:hypothetical protein
MTWMIPSNLRIQQTGHLLLETLARLPLGALPVAATAPSPTSPQPFQAKTVAHPPTLWTKQYGKHFREI